MNVKNKQRKKQLKSIRKLDVGDSIVMGDYEIICVEKRTYTIIHKHSSIFDKTYDELEDFLFED